MFARPHHLRIHEVLLALDATVRADQYGIRAALPPKTWSAAVQKADWLDLQRLLTALIMPLPLGPGLMLLGLVSGLFTRRAGGLLIGITGNNGVDSGGNCTGQHFIVVGIA